MLKRTEQAFPLTRARHRREQITLEGALPFRMEGNMWWVSFLTGVFIGAALAIFLFALIIVGTEEKGNDKR